MSAQKTLFQLKSSPLDIDAQAERLYAEYPRKANKGDALTAMRKAIRQVGFDVLLEAIVEYAKACKATGKDRDYIPYPASWIRAKKWEDDRQQWWASAADREAETAFQSLTLFIQRFGLVYTPEQRKQNVSDKTIAVIKSIGGYRALCDGLNERTRQTWLKRFKEAWRNAG